MIQTTQKKEGKLSLIARIGVKYIPFELDEIAQEWVRQQPSEESITAVDLVSMVLGGQARVSSSSTHARLLKRIDDEDQMPLQLDFTQSFLSCEETGEKNNLTLCVVGKGSERNLKLLTEKASKSYSVENQIPIGDLSLNLLREIIESANISQAHPTIKRLTHWFAGRMEIWGLAYG